MTVLAGCTTAPGDAAGGDVGTAAPGPSEPTSSRGGAKVGQQVTWEHQDAGVTHTVAAVGGGFRSGDLEEGGTFSHRFPAAGTFAYRCTIHPDMRGTVRVSG